jgi:large subunit ribosomal protein L3
MMRSGVLAKKLGMSSVFIGQTRVPITLFSLEDCRVVGEKNLDEKRSALQVGIGKSKHPSKALQGVFAKNGLDCVPKKVKEFIVHKDCCLTVGSFFSASHFLLNQRVDVSGVTIGRGFAGGMKRWNFSGLRASHGVSVSHRSIGSTGQRQDPGRVFKNKKMPGHMGCRRVTVQNLSVVFVDEEKALLGVKGNVPGFEGSYVEIRDAVKLPLFAGVPVPGGILDKAS